ncbi:hypothetical protein KGQ25_01815 [Patescibacteria group bacterium]|nr:hypothetical protein [Patescibacteria group bacterium]
MDTVIIKLNGFKVQNISLFLPELTKRTFNNLSPTEKQSTRRYLRAFRFEPPYQDAYLPKIEVFEAFNADRDAVVYTLQATFSVPKLIYGNSVQEVGDGDLDKVIAVLRRALLGAGIEISSDAIATARVAQVDFCKNVILPRDLRMQEVLTELQRTDISKAIDMTQKEYKYGGRTLHIYSQTVERVFYDKVHDATRPRGKRKDKGAMEREREVIDLYGLQDREIFRYEYRLKKSQGVKQKINVALGRPYLTTVLFKDLFEPALCKTILLQSWHDLIQRPENQLALLGPRDDLALLHHIVQGAHKQSTAHSMNRALTSYGLTRAIRDHGAKEVRKAAAGWNANHGERLTKKMQVAAALTEGLPYSNGIAFIAAALEQFECITRSTLENVV